MRRQPNFMSTYLPWVNAFNQEKALVGDFQEIVKFCEVSFAALMFTLLYGNMARVLMVTPSIRSHPNKQQE